MLKYLKLLRVQNLIFIPLTQYLMRFFIIRPILQINGLELQMPEMNFFLLVLCTMLIAGAGYAINDYFDRKIDWINKPARVVVGKKIDRRFVIIIHLVLNALAVIIGFYLAWKIHIWTIGFVYIIIAGLLWYYSVNYKRQFLIGNLLVALLVALVPFQVIVYEALYLVKAYPEFFTQHESYLKILFYWVGAFSFFAFLTNFIREVIKDIEDFEGDLAFGRNSMPVVLGISATKTIIIVLTVFTVSLLGYLFFRFVPDTLSIIYYLVFLAAPMIILSIQVYKAEQPKEYKRASAWLKFTMFTGVMYSVLAYFIITKKFLL